MKCEAINLQNQENNYLILETSTSCAVRNQSMIYLQLVDPCVISLSQYRVFECDKAAQQRGVQAHYAH